MPFIADPDEREIEVLRGLMSFRGMNVLDIGCGEGRTARRIARTAASVIGVDPDPERIARALNAPREEDGSCDPTFLAENIVTFDSQAAQFDVVIFTRSL